MRNLIRINSCGLYCEAGKFYIDPWKPVEKALVTHAHSDHTRPGHNHYLCVKESEELIRARIGDINVQTLSYNESLNINGITVSFHPAGHILGSAQIRIEHKGKVLVVSGDYKVEPDSTCAHFEPVKCNEFLTESTFGLPIYKWESQDIIFSAINEWWRCNREKNKTSIIYCYALGKAQRIISGLDPALGKIFVHGAVENMTNIYRDSGIKLPETVNATLFNKKSDSGNAVIVAPVSANGTPWLRRFGDIATSFASGWMQIRGARRRRAVDRGFALSDHADWNGLIDTIKLTEAEKILVTHGYSNVLAKWLNENGWNASPVNTLYSPDSEDSLPDDSYIMNKNYNRDTK
jgi:putative mRNA 3-end processing factor